MSRVMKPGNKFMNTTKYPPRVTNPSKVKRIKGENPNPSKAKSLTDWLFLKYDMSYKTYRNKSKKRRDELRQEYESETVMILANLGQRSCNSRTTFPKYTDSVLKLFGQEHCHRRTSWHIWFTVYHNAFSLSSAGG